MSWIRRGVALGLGVGLLGSVFGGPAAATDGVDVVLYEVTEAVQTDVVRGRTFRNSTAMLTGTARTGTPLCPAWLAIAQIEGCRVVVRSVGRANDLTGIGPVSGVFEVMIQDTNLADAPEIVVARGRIRGRIDLSAAFQHDQPLGSITGDFSGGGLAGTVLAGDIVSGRFRGTFRLPFLSGGQASYLLDDGSVVPAQAYEYSIGYPAVRLDVTLSER